MHSAYGGLGRGALLKGKMGFPSHVNYLTRNDLIVHIKIGSSTGFTTSTKFVLSES